LMYTNGKPANPSNGKVTSVQSSCKESSNDNIKASISITS
jgi:hypothetical protein